MSSRSRVDLPQPLGPTIATNSPGRTSKRHVVEDQRAVVGVAEGEPAGLDRAGQRPGPGARACAPPASPSSTGLISSNSGSAATAETKAPVSWVTEVSSIVTEVLKVRNSAADIAAAGRAGQQHEHQQRAQRQIDRAQHRGEVLDPADLLLELAAAGELRAQAAYA